MLKWRNGSNILCYTQFSKLLFKDLLSLLINAVIITCIVLLQYKQIMRGAFDLVFMNTDFNIHLHF